MSGGLPRRISYSRAWIWTRSCFGGRGLTGLRTKKAMVREALRWLVRLHEQAGVRELRGPKF